MAPHRSSRLRHFKLSDDIVILILEFCDPLTVYRAAKAFTRLGSLVRHTQSLSYKSELAWSGMQDGPQSHATVPTRNRHPLLTVYRNFWPQMRLDHELTLEITAPSQVGVSGSFLYEIRTGGNSADISLREMPSFRLGISPSKARYRQYTSTTPADSLAVDESQSLIVLAHVLRQNGLFYVEFNFKDFYKFTDHKKASTGSYRTGVLAPTHGMSIYICGSKVAVTMSFGLGKVRHLLYNWRNGQAMWLDDIDIFLLNEHYLLGTREIHGIPAIFMYNITKVEKYSTVAQYQLPSNWAGSVIGFGQNMSPRMDASINPNAVFYQDPANRVLLVMSCPPPRQRRAAEWLFVKESAIRPPGRKEPSTIPWNYWGQKCLLRTQPSTMKEGPCVCGDRVIYLSHDNAGHLQGHETGNISRVNLIDFSGARPDEHRSASWIWAGLQAHLLPGEVSRVWKDDTLIESIFATEDNLILINEISPLDRRSIKVLTTSI